MSRAGESASARHRIVAASLAALAATCHSKPESLPLIDGGEDCLVGFELTTRYLGSVFALTAVLENVLLTRVALSPRSSDLSALWMFEAHGATPAEGYVLRNAAFPGQHLTSSYTVVPDDDEETSLWLVETVPEVVQADVPLYLLRPADDPNSALGVGRLPPYPLTLQGGETDPGLHWRLAPYRSCAAQ